MTKEDIAFALAEATDYDIKDIDVDSLLFCTGVELEQIQSVYVTNGYIIRIVMLPSFYPILTDMCTTLTGDLLVVRDFLKKRSK